ncbi:MAG: hypothetical protein EAX95_00720 [Candidatus Thorarchaeota archaeon]|nr:hypothetical protein [Candidatus Thorarchaeota archaeon]
MKRAAPTKAWAYQSEEKEENANLSTSANIRRGSPIEASERPVRSIVTGILLSGYFAHLDSSFRNAHMISTSPNPKATMFNV